MKCPELRLCWVSGVERGSEQAVILGADVRVALSCVVLMSCCDDHMSLVCVVVATGVCHIPNGELQVIGSSAVCGSEQTMWWEGGRVASCESRRGVVDHMQLGRCH